MIGLDLKQQFLDALSEGQDDMEVLGLRKIYTALDMAAGLYVRETRGLRSEAVITTIEGQQAYDLPPDFIEPCVRQRYARGSRSVVVAKYVYGDNTAWPVLMAYERIFRSNRVVAVSVPNGFCIQPKVSAASAITGSVTSAGTLTAGEATLTNVAEAFVGAVSARDVVINTSRNSAGVVLEVVDNQNIQCALFPEGINSWQLGDGYRIQPEARKQLYLDAPSADAGHTLRLPYIAQPGPVFAENRSWRLDDTACRAIAFEAAWLHALSSPKLRANKAHHALFLDAVKAERHRIALKALEGV